MSNLMKSSGTLSTSDNHRISYHHYKAGHNKAILIAHGFYNSKASTELEKLRDALLTSYDVFAFDFRGHGESSGLFSWTTHEGKDLKAALDHLKGRYEKIGLIAFSLGGSISINVLSETSLAHSLVCVSAPCDFNRIDYKFWELSLKDDLIYTLFAKEGRKGKGVRPGAFWLKKKKPIDSVGEIKIPIFYIHGTRDWVIKPWHSRALYDKTHSIKKLVEIENGPHAEFLMKGNSQKFIGEIKSWFEKTLKEE